MNQTPILVEDYLTLVTSLNKISSVMYSELEILAPKKVYTRANSDPEPATSMSDTEKLMHKRKERITDPTCYLDRNLSLPKDGVKIIDDLDFELLFEQTMSRSRLESYLNEIISDEKMFQSLIPTNPHELP